jgi:DNA-binding MarR family transcriptional regulator
MQNTIKKCPLCRRHCPVDALECDKGRKYQEQLLQKQENLSAEADVASNEKMLPGEKHTPSADEHLTQLLHQILHLFFYRHGRHIRGQGRILHLLHHFGGMTQRELQEYANIKSGSLSELLEKAESNGFLSRFRCKEDKRNVNVSLTDLGKQNALNFDQEKNQIDKSLFADLSEEEKKTLEFLLSKLMKAWENPENAEREFVCSHDFGHHLHGRGRGLWGKR